MSFYKVLRREINANKDLFDLLCKTINFKNINDYKMLTDLDYRYKHLKINN